MKKNFIAFTAAVAAIFSITSCSLKGTDPYLACAVLKDYNVEYWRQVGFGFRNQAYGSGYASYTAWVDSDSDAKGQIAYVDTIGRLQNFRHLGMVYAPIYTETDHSAEQAVADFAKKFNVPVVVIDTPIDEENSPLKDVYKCYIGTDNKAAGTQLAEKINAPVEKIVCFLIPSSQPAIIRYEAMKEKFGEDLAVVEATRADIKEKVNGVKEDNPDAEIFVFLNGELLNEALENVGDKTAYSVDIYDKVLKNLKDGGCVKGILAQDTFSMGRLGVLALTANVSSKEIFVDPIYISAGTMSDTVVQSFLTYYESLTE